MGHYDVGVDLKGSSPVAGSLFPLKLQWGGNGPVAGSDGLLWIRDQRASGRDPACSTRESVLTAMVASNGKREVTPVNGVITVLIAPH
jgi:hypothetical protein